MKQKVEKEIIPELKRSDYIISFHDVRENGLIHSLLNVLFLWDFQIHIYTNQWIKRNKSKIHQWQEILETFDVWISFSTYAFNHPFMIYPTVEPKDYCYIDAKAVKHPLISGQNIPNDYHIEGKGAVDLITGANMSGKSTFLRTVGVNLVFAMIGLPVYANTFTFSPVKVYISMRTTDNINKGESYFFAEIIRLKEILTVSKTKPSLIIIDEMLKGTNSFDKLEGSKLLVEQLFHSKAATLIATHDLELCNLYADHPKIRCKYFDTQIVGKQIQYTYKIKKGIATQTNALTLMQKVGILNPPKNVN